MELIKIKKSCVTCITIEGQETHCLDCGVNYSNWQPVLNLLNGYQIAAMRTAGMENKIYRLGNFALGIAGEAGEVADYIKKVLYHGHPMDKDKLCKELGDVLWYIATLADTACFTLEEVARVNIEKLKKRYPEGFNKERSINRGDEQHE